jgi:hypothetical protein
METITLKYGANQQDYRVKSVKGLDSPDEIELWPAIQDELLDGILDDDILGYRRIVTIEFGVIDDAALKAFIVNFMISPQKILIYNAEEVQVSMYDPKGYTYEWRENIKFASALTLRFKERNLNTTLVGYPPLQPVGVGYLNADNQWTGVNTFLNTVYIGDLKELRTVTFTKGLTGQGFGFWWNDEGEPVLSVGGLQVRGGMVVRELLFQQVRTFNGSVLIGRTGTGKVKNVAKILN